MTDLTPTIQAKSDQLNADDLVSGPITIKITDVSLGSGDDQPIIIRYEGDNGKPWKPCKTMRRLLVSIWGADGNKYIGQMATLYRDPDVKWAGQPVGGIRVSHMSGIDGQKTLALTETRGKKRPIVVMPLQSPSGQNQPRTEQVSDDKDVDIKRKATNIRRAILAADTPDKLSDLWVHEFDSDLKEIKIANKQTFDFLDNEYVKRDAELNNQGDET